MIRHLTTIALLALFAATASAQRGRAPEIVDPQVIPLWENGAPGALGNEDRDQPTITAYYAYGRQSTGTPAAVAGASVLGGMAQFDWRAVPSAGGG